jgi:hypothetical protein
MNAGDFDDFDFVNKVDSMSSLVRWDSVNSIPHNRLPVILEVISWILELISSK